MNQFTQINIEKTGRLARDLFSQGNAETAICLLASVWNRLTSPSALRTDAEFEIANRLARAVKRRLLSYAQTTSTVRLDKFSNGAYHVVSRR